MNVFGTLFKIQIFGESHGKSIGLLIDGIRPGLTMDYDLIKTDLERRKPSYKGSTPRKEKDEYIIESGIDNGITTGTPLLIRIPNENIISKDYDFKDTPRPSHTDFVSLNKYKGFNTLPGSGHFSGRLTTPIVIAGAIAKMMVPYRASTKYIQVGTLKDTQNIEAYIEKIVESQDSVGAVIKVTVKDVPIGLGEPFFESVESKIASILYSIPGVKGVSFGIGFSGVSLVGSQFNDPIINEKGDTLTNHSGGINGGISNGNDLVINVFIRPASSISKPQQTYNFKEKKQDTITIKGRHDAFFARRAIVVIENAILIALTDLTLLKKAYD